MRYNNKKPRNYYNWDRKECVLTDEPCWKYGAKCEDCDVANTKHYISVKVAKPSVSKRPPVSTTRMTINTISSSNMRTSPRNMQVNKIVPQPAPNVYNGPDYAPDEYEHPKKKKMLARLIDKIDKIF
jgi:hypothetical protein